MSASQTSTTAKIRAARGFLRLSIRVDNRCHPISRVAVGNIQCGLQIFYGRKHVNKQIGDAGEPCPIPHRSICRVCSGLRREFPFSRYHAGKRRA